ncbi:MAG TPA: hypothetical protein GX521_07305 [Firmicutes bacterium]|nr:hypothetical protein [Bacillota bacterium]
MEIKQQVSQIQIERSGPEINIEQAECLNELGAGSYVDLSLQIRQAAYEKVLTAIAALSREGDEVMAKAGRFQERMIFSEIYSARMAAEIPELNIEAAPRTRPKIDFHYEMGISWAAGGAEIEYRGSPPRISWEMGAVRIQVEQASKEGWIG